MKITDLTFKDWIIIILIGLCVGMFAFNRYYHHQLKYDQKVYSDSLVNYKNKNGELYKETMVYVQNIKDLKKQNSDLAKEVKSLKDNPIVVIKTNTEVKIDSLILHDSVYYKDNELNIRWNYAKTFSKNNYVEMNGLSSYNDKTKESLTILNHLMFQADLYLDIIEKNKQLNIIAKSNNPYLTFTSIESSFVSPDKSKVLKNYFRPSRWSIGLYGGYGMTAYDGKVVLGPQIGVGVNFSIIRF